MSVQRTVSPLLSSSTSRWHSVDLYHSAEGGAVCRHGGGAVALCWSDRPHQQGAAVYGVFSPLGGRRRARPGTRRVGNVGLEDAPYGVHLAGHHGNAVMSCN